MKTDIDNEDYLIKLCQMGCGQDRRDAFSKLIIKHEKNIYNFCCGYLLDPMEAKDAAQDVFWKAFLKIESFKGQSPRGKVAFSTWLHQIAKNHCENIRGVMNRMKTIDIEDPKESDINTYIAQETSDFRNYSTVELSDYRECVVEIVNKLDEKYRSVIHLIHFENLSYKEAAKILGCPIGTIRSRLSRALDIIRLKLDKNKIKLGDI